jgi:hypothetical protein
MTVGMPEGSSMSNAHEYTRGERAALIALGTFGFAAVNGTFIYSLLFQPDALDEALANPLSAAFMVEALVLAVALACLLRKWRVSRVSAVWFVVLSLVGSIAFALPVALLWPRSGGRH